MAVFILVPMAAFGLAGLAISMAQEPEEVDVGAMALSLGAIASLLVGAGLAKRGRVIAGVLLAVVTMEAVIWALFRIAEPDEQSALIAYLAIPVLIAGLTLPPKWASGVTAVSVASAPAAVAAFLPNGLASESLLTSTLILLALVGVVAVVSSVVQQRTLQALDRRAAEIQRSAAALRDASADRIRLLQQIAHDLGAPLTPVKLQLAILGKRLTRRDDQESLAMLDRNVGHLHRLVDDVKGLALMEGQGFTIEAKDIDFAACVRESIESLRAGAQARGVGLVDEVQGPIPLRGDPVRLAQVLYNLVGNAVKFSPPGSKVTVAAGLDAGHARVAVHDEGPGLTADQIARLFRPFGQVHDKALQPFEDRGTGLGLFITKGIVEGHGGSIAATSPGPGHGSTFTFHLPLAGPAHGPG